MKNLIIIGPGRTGTTSLFRLLAKIDGVSASRQKEMHYFSRGVIAYGEKLASAGKYLDLFSREAVVTLEATPAYFLGSEVIPSLISKATHDPYVICVMREPYSRIRSLHQHVKNKVIFDNSLTLNEFLVKSSTVGPKEIASVEEALHYSAIFESDYARHLSNWCTKLGRDRVVILDYEKLNDSNYLFSKLGFLFGRSVSELDFNIGETNVSANVRYMFFQRLAQKANENFEVILNALPRIRGALKNIYSILNKKSSEKVTVGRVNSAEWRYFKFNFRGLAEQYDVSGIEYPSWLQREIIDD